VNLFPLCGHPRYLSRSFCRVLCSLVKNRPPSSLLSKNPRTHVQIGSWRGFSLGTPFECRGLAIINPKLLVLNFWMLTPESQFRDVPPMAFRPGFLLGKFKRIRTRSLFLVHRNLISPLLEFMTPPTPRPSRLTSFGQSKD